MLQGIERSREGPAVPPIEEKSWAETVHFLTPTHTQSSHWELIRKVSRWRLVYPLCKEMQSSLWWEDGVCRRRLGCLHDTGHWANNHPYLNVPPASDPNRPIVKRKQLFWNALSSNCNNIKDHLFLSGRYAKTSTLKTNCPANRNKISSQHKKHPCGFIGCIILFGKRKELSAEPYSSDNPNAKTHCEVWNFPNTHVTSQGENSTAVIIWWVRVKTQVQ